jgi:hypothetical protein
METNNIKTLTITGGAAIANEGAKKTPRRSASRRKQIEEFTEESDSPMSHNVPMDMAKPQTQHKPRPNTSSLTESQTTPVVRYNITKSSITSSLPSPLQVPLPVKKSMEMLTQTSTPAAQVTPLVNINQNQKVILKPQSPRVKLLNTASQHNGGHRTKIATRKIRRVNIPNLNRKFTRAHKTSLETKETPLDSIRTFLVGKGVIQEKSKAPEKMLRSMYNDFALLKTNAL